MSLIDFSVQAPQGPGTPFLGLGFAVLDTVRLIVIALGMVVIFTTPFAMRKTHTLGQKTRLAATALFAFSVVGTEFSHLGDYAHYRLLINTMGSVFAVWGIWSMFRWERPSEFRT